MKQSTIILLGVAVLAGGAGYYFWKKGQAAKLAPPPTQPSRNPQNNAPAAESNDTLSTVNKALDLIGNVYGGH